MNETTNEPAAAQSSMPPAVTATQVVKLEANRVREGVCVGLETLFQRHRRDLIPAWGNAPKDRQRSEYPALTIFPLLP